MNFPTEALHSDSKLLSSIPGNFYQSNESILGFLFYELQ